jgi:hypothetical protein
MKITTTLVAAVVVVLLTILATSLVQAQTTEKIALYADKAGTDCSISDTEVRTVIVHMIHVGTGLRLGALFRAPKPDCWMGATWVGDGFPAGYLFAFSSQSAGLEVSYMACLPLPVYIGKIIFEATGAAQECCPYPVLPTLNPIYPHIVAAIDCFSRLMPVAGGSVVINENASCPCAPPLAVESTTWGRVKSLYN